jgi:hypothetical protein
VDSVQSLLLSISSKKYNCNIRRCNVNDTVKTVTKIVMRNLDMSGNNPCGKIKIGAISVIIITC